MKYLLAACCVIALISLAACANPGAVREVKGRPVYKFLNFGGIDVKSIKANEAHSEQYKLFVSRGFDLHTPLKIQIESGKEIEVYVRNKDYKELWKTNPHDLARQKKSHLVTIKYIQVKMGGEAVNRAVSFESELVEREPIIRK